MRREAFERWVAKRKAWQAKAKRFYAKHWPSEWIEPLVYDEHPFFRLMTHDQG